MKTYQIVERVDGAEMIWGVVKAHSPLQAVRNWCKQHYQFAADDTDSFFAYELSVKGKLQ